MRALRPYLVGLGLVTFFTIVKVALPALGREVPFVLYFGAPLVAALLGGRWPGLVTAAVVAVVANFLFLGERGEITLTAPALAQCGTFFVEAAAVALVCDALLRARSRLLADKEGQLALVQQELLQRSRIELLQEVTVGLSRALTVADVASVIVDVATAKIGAPRGGVWQLSEDRAALQLVRHKGYSPEMVGAVERVPLDSELPIAQVLRTNEICWVGSRGEYAQVAPGGHAVTYPVRTSEETAFFCAPMLVEGRAVGAVAFNYDGARDFPEDERRLVRSVVEQCALAMHRAQLFVSERAAREAEAVALRNKDEFLAILGHELRNPLSPIMTATHLIRLRGAASERELGILERQGGHLVRLVDDLLDVSRITSGKLVLKRAHIELATVITQALESASKPLEDRRLRVEVDVPSSGLVVHGDVDRLVQVVTNLLVNAAKFTPPEKNVRVTASAREGTAVIQVRDEGEGIAPELLPHVFELFTQAKQSSDRSGGGLGLGLAIARSIVTAHGGVIAAETHGPNRGTTMTVTLPLVAVPVVALPDRLSGVREKPEAPRRRILIVDDNVDGAEMLADLFDTLGYETLVANDGPQALRFANETQLDAAVLDIGLPGMDGYELATEIRTRFGEKAPVLVALTGYTQASDRERALTSGFSAHLGKPIDMARLADTFERLLGAS